jgi:glutaredoxin
MNEPKLCKDCYYCSAPRYLFRKEYEYAKCLRTKRPTGRELVDGLEENRMEYCQCERKYNCGQEAKFFRPL